MEFAELNNYEKAMYTFNQIQKKKASVAKGKKDADSFNFENANKIKARLKGEKKVSLK